MRLARPFSLFFLALFALVLAACSGGKPESSIEAFYRAAEKGDVEKATEQISFAQVPAAQMVQAKGKVQMIVGEMQNRIKANDGLDKIQVEESTVDEAGKTAQVRVKIKYKNGKDQGQTHKLVNEDGHWKILLK
ncbi:hypothetical protein CDO44_22625 [Pigmentiphaga sp. NML080357]|uniref:DUF4878 domain-containing protein n=1 Tax=Pigmentiphaga sp. NML080357 TaxID=2008675 RepID=UPI000B40B50A|nr:DUF4878 domain-containing protein [Pigmentiphaga sp. NML080357]OVZ55048.1 hypothetical protein CDO44_22625 [Pigmentiphaga sp. NML080357]